MTETLPTAPDSDTTDQETLDAELLVKTESEEALVNVLEVLLPNESVPARARVAAFIVLTMEGKRFHVAAETVKVPWTSIHLYELHSQGFEELYALAKTAGHAVRQEQRENALHRRGVEGWEEPVFRGKYGGQVGTIRRFSDKCLEMALKAGDRKKYGDKVDIDHSGQVIHFHTAGVRDGTPVPRVIDGMVVAEDVQRLSEDGEKVASAPNPLP